MHGQAPMKKLIAPLLVTLLVSGCENQTSTDHLERAQQALNTNDFNTAIIELKNAAQLSPEDASIRFLLGKTYLELGQYPAAIKELERALDGGYDAAQVIPLLSTTYKRTGEVRDLFKLARKAKGLKQEDLAQLKLYQLQAYIEQGEHNKAKTLIAEIKEITKAGAYGQLALAYEFVIEQQFDNALLLLDEALGFYPNQADALKLKAQLLFNTEQTEQALETYQTYLTAYPKDVDVQFLLARLYSQLNQQDKAEPIIDSLLKEYANQPILLQLKASARASQQDHKVALEFAEQALTLQPEDTTSRLIAGVSAYFLEDFELSHSHLAMIASMLPSSHPALRILADCQLRLGMSLEANETVKRFNNLSEEDAVLAAQVGQTLLRQGEINKAKAILDKQPTELTNASSLLNIGALKLSLNDVSGIINLEQALDASAQSERLSTYQVEVTLAQAYLATNAYDKAMEIAQRWQGLEEQQVQGFLLAANVFQRQGKASEATTEYQKALQLHPDNPNLKLAIVNVEPMDTTEKRQAALAKVSDLLAEHPEFLQGMVQHFMLSKWLGQEEKMTEHLTKVIEQREDTPPAYNVALAKMHLLNGKTEQAIATFESIQTEQPQAFWGDLADAYVKTEQFAEAKQLYTRWFESTPNNPTATAGMMKVHSSQGNLNSALELADNYLNNLGGNSLEVRLLQSQLYIQTGQFEKAEKSFDTLPDSAKVLPFYKGLLGQVQMYNKQPEAAMGNLSEAYNTTPTPRITHFLTNAISSTQGTEAAMSFLKDHTGKQPKDELNTLRYAQMLTGKDNTEARTYYVKVLELNPNHYVANNNLANLYLNDGELEKARQHAIKALNIQPENVDVLDTMASIESQLGNQEQALKHLNQAFDKLKQKPNDVIFYNYVKVLIENDQLQLLKRRLGQYKTQDADVSQKIEQLLAEHGIENS